LRIGRDGRAVRPHAAGSSPRRRVGEGRLASRHDDGSQLCSAPEASARGDGALQGRQSQQAPAFVRNRGPEDAVRPAEEISEAPGPAREGSEIRFRLQGQGTTEERPARRPAGGRRVESPVSALASTAPAGSTVGASTSGASACAAPTRTAAATRTGSGTERPPDRCPDGGRGRRALPTSQRSGVRLARRELLAPWRARRRVDDSGRHLQRRYLRRDRSQPSSRGSRRARLQHGPRLRQRCLCDGPPRRSGDG
jgi:hypothetical protein